MNDWIWSASVNAISPDKRKIFAGTNKGHIAMYDIEFMTVHGLYED